jgi:uncharacterized protein YeaO (DUF488 family)
MIHIVQFFTHKEPDEGIRLGTVRRPPRGLPKEKYAKAGVYDVFFPTLSPTPWLLGEVQRHGLPWDQFCAQFRGEMQLPHPDHVLNCMAKLSRETCPDKRERIVADTLACIRNSSTDGARIHAVLPSLLQEDNFSIGCYCGDEGRCHRGVLRQLLRQRKALIAHDNPRL